MKYLSRPQQIALELIQKSTNGLVREGSWWISNELNERCYGNTVRALIRKELVTESDEDRAFISDAGVAYLVESKARKEREKEERIKQSEYINRTQETEPRRAQLILQTLIGLADRHGMVAITNEMLAEKAGLDNGNVVSKCIGYLQREKLIKKLPADEMKNNTPIYRNPSMINRGRRFPNLYLVTCDDYCI